MRYALPAMLCLLICACGGADAPAANNPPPANDATSGGKTEDPPKDTLTVDIEALKDEYKSLAAEIKAVSTEERSERRQEFTNRAKDLGERSLALKAKVNQTDATSEARKQWKAAELEIIKHTADVARMVKAIDPRTPPDPEARTLKTTLEERYLSDIAMAFNMILVDDTKKRKLRGQPFTEAKGIRFYEAALKHRLMDESLIKSIVSANSTSDYYADAGFIDGSAELHEYNCSYTAPKGGELLSTMVRRGGNRCVMITFNSRNWSNYPDKGVLVVWSDGDMPQWMTFEQARDDWGITEEEWADPAGKLFGQKAPFQHTYE